MSSNKNENAALEIHDSTVERIESVDGQLIVVLDAYVHRSAGRPGVDRGTGWSQPIHLRFRGGKSVGSLPTMPLELLAGRLILGENTLTNLVPMPLDHAGPTRLELESWNDTRLIVEGDAVAGTFVGVPRYIEEFDP